MRERVHEGVAHHHGDVRDVLGAPLARHEHGALGETVGLDDPHVRAPVSLLVSQRERLRRMGCQL